MAFCLHKWDIEKMTPKQSGKTLDDVIYYVRTSMYNDLVGPSNIDSDTEDENTTDSKKKVENKDNVDDENNELPMPSNYIFPSFFAFMTWGPFACADKRLSVFI